MHLEHVRGLDRIQAGRVFLAGLPLRLPGRADGGPASPVVLTDCPTGDPHVQDLSLPVEVDWRGRVERFVTLSFENGDQVQETGVRFSGPSHTHVLTPRYIDPDEPGIEAWIGAPLVREYDILDLTDVPDRQLVSRDMLEERYPSTNPDAVLLRTGYSDRMPYAHPDWEERSPWLEAEAARFLVDRGCRVIALDFEADAGRKQLKVDGPSLGDLDAEKILLGGGAALVKNLQATTALMGETVTLLVMPLLLPGAESAPARVVGLRW
jgi:kynurenine formamidase